MEDRELTELLKALFENRIEEKDFNRFGFYLLNLMRRASSHLAEDLKRRKESEFAPRSLFSGFGENEEDNKELLYEFLTHLISKKNHFLDLMERGERIKAYLWQVARNFMIDLWKRKVRKELVTESIDKEQEEERPRELKDEDALLSFEILEVELLVLSVIEEEEFKYLCYSLNSERYLCLWGNKSKDAVYKDVSRKRERVLQKLGKALHENGVTEELFGNFVRIRLSEICEELRSKHCEESKT
jgi:DNA-directed RNA polymerase specialized sigma24 family protein